MLNPLVAQPATFRPPGGVKPAVPRSVLRAVAVAGLTGGAVLGTGQLHLLHGWLAIAALIVAVLAVPTSRQLSRRILFAGSICFGWVPVLWWQVLPVGNLGRSAILLAVLAACLGGWVAAAPDPSARLRLLMPRPRPIDALPILVALFAALMLHNWLRVDSGRRALAILLQGWDNSGHYDMVEMIRTHGATIDALAAPASGTSWYYASYPQGFHASMASLMELMSSPKVGSTQAELVGYAHAMALVVICLATMLAAGVCALPSVRSCPRVAAPLVCLVATPFMLGPGADSMRSGFANFLLAAALVGCAAFIAVSTARVTPLHVTALGGTLVGVAHSWALLLTLAVPAALVAAAPLRRRRWDQGRPRQVLSLMLIGLTVLAVLHAGQILLRQDVGNLLTIDGGIVFPRVSTVVATCAVSLCICLALAFRRFRHSSWPAVSLRAAWLAGALFAGIASASALAIHEVHSTGAVSYYFWKFATGLELVCFIVLAIGLAAHLVRVVKLKQPSTRSSLVGAMLASFAVVLVLGSGSGAFAGARNAQAISLRLAAADGLMSAAQVQTQHPDAVAVYLAFPPYALRYERNAEEWYRALTQTWTTRAYVTGMEDLRLMSPTIDDGVIASRRILEHDPTQLVVVAPEYLASIREGLSEPAQRERIVSW